MHPDMHRHRLKRSRRWSDVIKTPEHLHAWRPRRGHNALHVRHLIQVHRVRCVGRRCCRLIGEPPCFVRANGGCGAPARGVGEGIVVGEVDLCLLAADPAGLAVVCAGGLLSSGEGAQPYPNAFHRVADLRCPLPPRPMPYSSVQVLPLPLPLDCVHQVQYTNKDFLSPSF